MKGLYFSYIKWDRKHYIYIFAKEKGLSRVYLSDPISFKPYLERIEKEERIIKRENAIILSAIDSLEYYIKREPKFLEHIPLLLEGTEFQRRVWLELKKIPFGKVVTYKDIGERIGIEKGYRAIGRACALNKFPIFIPCHRVIGSDKKLKGFSSGVEWKRFLLRHEGIIL